MRRKRAALLLSFLIMLNMTLHGFAEEATEAPVTENPDNIVQVVTTPEPDAETPEETPEPGPAPFATMPVTDNKDMPKPSAEAKAEAVVMSPEGLKVMDTPSLSGVELAELDAGTILNLLILGQTWSKVQSGDILGYVPSNGLVFGFGTSQPVLAIAVAPNGKLTLRAEMTTKSKAIDTISSGQAVLLLAKGETFSLVRYQDKEGYMLTQHLNEVPVNTETGTYTEVISLDSKRVANVRLRAEPKKTAAVYTSVKSSNFLVVLSVSDGWAEVEYEGFHGYMMEEYLKK